MRVFLGSSLESKDSILKPLEEHLHQNGIKTTPWDMSLTPGEHPLDDLHNQAQHHDGAVFIFSTEDLTISRGREHITPRDNVLLEYGIFLGAMRRERVFILTERSVKIATDILGITTLHYDSQDAAHLPLQLRESAAKIALKLRRLGPSRLPGKDPDGLLQAYGSLERKTSDLKQFLRLRSISPGTRPAEARPAPPPWEPIKIDGKDDALDLYFWGLRRTVERYWTTSFFLSGFWTDTGIAFHENKRMLERAGNRDLDSRRIIILGSPLDKEARSIGKRLRDLHRLEQEDEIKHMLHTVRTVISRHRQLEAMGGKTKVCHLTGPRRELRINGEKINLLSDEIALFDSYRLDVYPGGEKGTIEGVTVFCQGIRDFADNIANMSKIFSELWNQETTLDAEVLFRKIEKELDESEKKIDHVRNYAYIYEHLLQERDNNLKRSELAATRRCLQLMGIEEASLDRYLDIGTCTGRYPLELRPYVKLGGTLYGVDTNRTLIRIAERKLAEATREAPDPESLPEVEFRCIDVLSPDFFLNQKCDLITCMLGTVSYLNYGSSGSGDTGPVLERLVRKVHDHLTEGGVFILSNWSDQIRHSPSELVSIYEPFDTTRIARNTPATSCLQELLEKVGFRIEHRKSLGRLVLLGCRRVGA